MKYAKFKNSMEEQSMSDIKTLLCALAQLITALAALWLLVRVVGFLQVIFPAG